MRTTRGLLRITGIVALATLTAVAAPAAGQTNAPEIPFERARGRRAHHRAGG